MINSTKLKPHYWAIFYWPDDVSNIQRHDKLVVSRPSHLDHTVRAVVQASFDSTISFGPNPITQARSAARQDPHRQMTVDFTRPPS